MWSRTRRSTRQAKVEEPNSTRSGGSERAVASALAAPAAAFPRWTDRRRAPIGRPTYVQLPPSCRHRHRVLLSSPPTLKQHSSHSVRPPVRPPCHRLLALAKSFRPRAPQRERFTHARTGAVIAGRGGDGLRCWNAGTRDTTGGARRMPTRRAPEPPELSSWEAAQGRRPGLSPRPCVFCLNGMPLLVFVDVGAASPARLS